MHWLLYLLLTASWGCLEANSKNCTLLRPCNEGLPRQCVIGPHQRDYDFFRSKISLFTQGFAVVRYGDGEFNLMIGKRILKDSQAYLVDRFWSDGGQSTIGNDLMASLCGHYGEPYYYAFASPSTTDDSSGLKWLLERTEQRCEFLSYANLWVNAMYHETKIFLENYLLRYTSSSVVIANHQGLGRLRAMNKLNFKFLELPDFVNKVWKGEMRENLLRNATMLAKSVMKHYFFVSGGPMAKVLISYMWNSNKANIYLDFGSSMDEVLKGVKTRPYMYPTNGFSQTV